jgi:twitching motility protein PilU
MVDCNATDMYLTVGCPPTLRIDDRMMPLGEQMLEEQLIRHLLSEIVSEEIMDEFQATLEMNTAIGWKEIARFRINAYRQQQHTAVVIRRIITEIPTVESLGLPPVYSQLAMEKRGMVLVVGPTGSGKSTSLAAMIGHRNRHSCGHIITVEDPIEFVHRHDGCIISQRDVGIDTYSFGIALKNALRQRPDVVLIGEIRDRETMEHALMFAETGHLCLATLHANNANQTIERIVNFFPEEKHPQLLLSLSLNLKGILSQRLVSNLAGKRSLAVEILLNSGLVRNLIEEGKIKEIKDIMGRSRDQGMQTFDQALHDLYINGIISEETALHEADNPGNIKLQIKQTTMEKRMMTPMRDLDEMSMIERHLKF